MFKSWRVFIFRRNRCSASPEYANAVNTLVESIPFDRKDEINTGVESYSIFQNKKAKFQVVEYRDPETGLLHQFISTLPKSMKPGIIAMLYYISDVNYLGRSYYLI
jgi:hypothetical protein